MSMKERILGIWGGFKVAAMSPLAIPVAFMSAAGSGPGTALAVFFAGVIVVIGIIAVAVALPPSAWLNVFGVPWHITLPAAYFAAWGLVGFWWKIKP